MFHTSFLKFTSASHYSEVHFNLDFNYIPPGAIVNTGYYLTVLKEKQVITGNNLEKVSRSIKWLKRTARTSAWLLLISVIVLVLSGWGITHTEIIYKASFGLIDRRLADAIHTATNVPLTIFFLSHVFINIRLIISPRSPLGNWLINSVLIIVGLLLLVSVIYVEYWAA